MYVLVKTDSPRCGAYVAKPGLESSYTHLIRNAQTFSTKEEARRKACGNETPVELYGLILRLAGR